VASKAVKPTHSAASCPQSAAQQDFDGLIDIAAQAHKMISKDSVVGYTKKNPLQALAIAAASGALICAALKAFRACSD
jgi:hypothetical protein